MMNDLIVTTTDNLLFIYLLVLILFGF